MSGKSNAMLAAMLGVCASPAVAHVELDRAEPRVGSTITAAPQSVVLFFSEDVPDQGATGEVRDAAGVRVDAGGLTIDKAERRRALLKLKALRPGEYTVRWRATSDEGEETRGRFLFYVAP